MLQSLGFIESKSSPCVFYNAKTQVRAVAHVDDFLCTGPEEELQAFYRELNGKFELKCEILGPGAKDSKKGTFLCRLIEWHPWGISWKADEKLVKDMLQEWGMENCSEVSTPCSREEGAQVVDEKLTDAREISR